MKRTLFTVIATSLIMLLASSCRKTEYLPDTTSNSHPRPPITLNLTTYDWVPESEAVFVSTFSNVIPAGYTNPAVRVYLVQNENEEELSHFMSDNELLWATNTQTDIQIHYRGTYHNFWYLKIKVVIE